VKSPTYTVMEPYEVAGENGPINIWHFDFYRFNDPQEWEDAGFRDVFASTGLKLAEWPEKAEGLLPLPDLRVFIEPGLGDQREVRITAHTARGVELLQ
jgi:tRNA threonylcarbamoyladenosine biosynthesis protein TsaE